MHKSDPTELKALPIWATKLQMLGQLLRLTLRRSQCSGAVDAVPQRLQLENYKYFRRDFCCCDWSSAPGTCEYRRIVEEKDQMFPRPVLAHHQLLFFPVRFSARAVGDKLLKSYRSAVTLLGCTSRSYRLGGP